jgi:hypothetical protein
MSTYLKLSPPDEPVYRFIDKKRAEGKLLILKHPLQIYFHTNMY